MAQPPKTAEQIQAMREGGKILATLLSDLKQHVQVGMTGLEVDAWVASEITRHGATATYKEPVPDFPGVKDNQVPFSRFKQRRCIVRRNDFDRVVGESGRDGH